MKDIHGSSPHSVAVVEDDAELRDLIIGQLAEGNYRLFAAEDVNALKGLLERQSVDLIILDLNLPDGDGLALCREMRAASVTTPIMMVTARANAQDRILGLELGADDYLTKPFEPRELLARVRNLLRRSHGLIPAWPSNARFVSFGPWRLDFLQRRLIAPDGRLVMLSSAEFRLLSRFVEHPRTVMSRETLSPERRATVAFDRSIDLQISRLRQKLGSIAGGEELILTVRNGGYMLASPVHFE